MKKFEYLQALMKANNDNTIARFVNRILVIEKMIILYHNLSLFSILLVFQSIGLIVLKSNEKNVR